MLNDVQMSPAGAGSPALGPSVMTLVLWKHDKAKIGGAAAYGRQNPATAKFRRPRCRAGHMPSRTQLRVVRALLRQPPSPDREALLK